MCLSITSYKTCSVNSKYYRKFSYTHIMYYLVVSSLKKCRIYCYYRFHSHCCQTCCKCNRMFFCYTYIKKSVGVFSCHCTESCSRRHCSRNSCYIFISVCKFNNFFAENRSICQLFFLIFKRTVTWLKRCNSVKCRWVIFCRQISFSFFCAYMDYNCFLQL